MTKRNCPYTQMPDTSFWKRSVSDIDAAEFMPLLETVELIDRQTRVGTAGSCFAQNISRRLKSSGFHYYVAEQGPDFFDPQSLLDSNYGVFSCRYGNVYTTTQLDQLFDRAFGEFVPVEEIWAAGEACVDPFRPRIQPAGFLCAEELLADRTQHLAAVKEMFQTIDVFVFTLGLTEAWVDRRDGAVFPVCPGCGAGGTFNSSIHAFRNFRYTEVYESFAAFHRKAKAINANMKFLVTVSPVPLIATAAKRHVAESTMYSKSVLRAAAGDLATDLADVFYFPSYEIFKYPFSGQDYFAADRREVNEAGVEHAMAMFFKYFCGVTVAESRRPATVTAPAATVNDEVAQSVCDELIYDLIR